jgi:DMSO/TMAO reductase YedYZ molybdopterin-dependent catalytic subunit
VPAASHWPEYRLRVGGAVERPGSYAYDELAAMAAESLTASFLCGTGERWGGTWHGVAIGDLLERAGAAPDTTHVLVEGDGGYVACVPVGKALGGLVALEREEGGPLGESVPTRLIVPGIEAARTVKDVRRLAAVVLGPDEDPEDRERRVDESPRDAPASDPAESP